MRLEVRVEQDVVLLLARITAVVSLLVASLLLGPAAKLKLLGLAVGGVLVTALGQLRGRHVLAEGRLVSACVARESAHVSRSFGAALRVELGSLVSLGGGLRGSATHIVVHHVFIDVVVVLVAVVAQ